MGSRNFDIVALQARFDTLTDLEQAAQWVRFVDGLDAGDAGYHPYYLILAPIFDRGESPFDAQQAEMEPRQLLQGELDFEAYQEDLETVAFTSTGTGADLILGAPPF